MVKDKKHDGGDGGGGGHGNKWEKDTTERLKKLQEDVDAMECELGEIKKICNEILDIVKELEEKGNLSRITAQFERRTLAI